MTKRHKTRMTKRSRIWIALFYWTKLTGVNTFSLTKSDELESSYYSVIYVFLLAVCYTCVSSRTLIDRWKYAVPGDTPISVIVHTIGIICSYLEVLCVWLGFCFFQKRSALLMRCYATVERTSTELDLPNDGTKYLKKLAVYMVVVNSIFVIYIGSSTIVWARETEFSINLWLLYNLARLAPNNTIIMFIWSLFVVKEKFRLLNERVDSLFVRNDCTESQGAGNDVILGSTSSISILNLRSESRLPLYKIEIFSRLHRELKDAIHRIQEHFALSIMANVTSQLVYMTAMIYVIFRYVKTHGLIKTGDVFYVTTVFWGILISVTRLFIISNACTSTSHEANKTGNLLHAIANNCGSFSDNRLTAKLNAFSLDLLQNKTRISLYGCFDLDGFFVYRIIATVTSYLIIMLQFDS